MALQDLTPQLRTRLNRTEKAAGWFVMAAFLLLILGFSYYLYHTAQTKGWFITKVKYQTGVNNAAGLKVGDPVKLMGRDSGQITAVIPNDPYAGYGLTVFFSIKAPDFGYIWSDSTVKVQSDFIGNRYLEVTKGTAGIPTVITETNGSILGVIKRKVLRDRQKELETEQAALDKQQLEQKTGDTGGKAADAKPESAVDKVLKKLNAEANTDRQKYYDDYEHAQVCWIHPDESPALNDRLEKVASQIEQALPNVLAFTNQLAVVLNNGANLTSNLNDVASNMRPVASNLAILTEQLKGPGALGDWVLGTNASQRMDTNLTALFESFGASLENLSLITSNLNAQVQANTNLLGNLSTAIVNTDDLVQGLKRHWLLRSAFKKKATNAPPVKSGGK